MEPQSVEAFEELIDQMGVGLPLPGLMDPEEPIPEPEVDLEPEPEEPAIPEDELYWGARRGEKLIAAVRGKEEAYFQALERHQMPRMWRIMRAQYYGLNPEIGTGFETQEIGFDGEYGELIRFRINEVRSFVKQIITMATGNRPAFQAIATNTDYEALSQVKMADTMVHYLYEQSHGEASERVVMENAQNFARSLTWLRWDTEGGEDITRPDMVTAGTTLHDGAVVDEDTPTGSQRTMRTGDIDVTTMKPWEHFCEPYQEDPRKHQWRGMRERRSKWEVEGQYPELRGKLSGDATADEWARWFVGNDEQALSGDDVIVRHWYHVKNRHLGLPEGRYVIFCGEHILYDGPLPCSRIPAEELCPNRFIGNAFGYSDAWDMCSVNQMVDQIVSDVASNLCTFGRQLIVTDEGTDFDLNSIAQGIRFLKKQPNQAAPEAVQLAEIPAVSLEVIAMLRATLQSLSGLNSVVRGDPNENIKSGTMAALFHSIALEFNSSLQQALDQYRQGVANLMLELVRLNADEGVVLAITGKAERPFLKQFTKQDAFGIKQVVIKTASPMLRTTAGRKDIADTVMEKMPGRLSMEAYIELLTTGQVSSLFNEPMSSMLRVQWENEQLRQGTAIQMVPADPDPLTGLPRVDPMTGAPVMDAITPEVPVIAGDNPALHIPEHYAELCDPEVLRDPKRRQAVETHLLWHLRVCRTTDPVMATAMHWPPELMALAMPQPAPMSAEIESDPEGGGSKVTAKSEPTKSKQSDLGVSLPKPPANSQAQGAQT